MCLLQLFCFQRSTTLSPPSSLFAVLVPNSGSMPYGALQESAQLLAMH